MANYKLIQDAMLLLEDFEIELQGGQKYSNDVSGFKSWISKTVSTDVNEPEWDNKSQGRGADSVISTLLLHMNRYAKTYSKSAISGSRFSTQEEFIYLINLKAFGGMSKMDLIKRNVQEKSAGMQIIKRLLQQEWIQQRDSDVDRRSKIIEITVKGLRILEEQMPRIRQATQVVSGDLKLDEKMELIRLLNKLNDFHSPIFLKNIENSQLLDKVIEDFYTKEATV